MPTIVNVAVFLNYRLTVTVIIGTIMVTITSKGGNTMTTYGYVRVSTVEQNEARQLATMKELGVERKNVFVDKASGKDTNRPQYQELRSTIQSGDLIYMDDLDRLGRSYDDVIDDWKYITRKVGADIVITSNAELFDSRRFKSMGDIGKLLEDQFLSMLAYVAEQERKKNKRRQREGIEIAKAKGKFKGRKTKLVEGGEEEVRRNAIIKDYQDGVSIADIRKTYKVGTGTIYRLLEREGIKR